jgi:uncharacterized protein (TIGR02145 family)
MKPKTLPLLLLPSIMVVFLMGAWGCSKEETNPLETGTVTDIDGNIYRTVKIGNQWWMAENLKTTKLIDSTVIPLVPDYEEFFFRTTPAYCWYRNDSVVNKRVYGALYNWFTVNTGKLAPVGWHVPADAEWDTLVNYLGGDMHAGYHMKESGSDHWADWYSDASNSSGFTALPGGARQGIDNGLYFYGSWWTATEASPTATWGYHMAYWHSVVDRDSSSKAFGYSIRCIKN